MVRVLVTLELLLALRVMLLAAAGDPWPIGHGLTWRTSGGWVGVAYSRPDPAWAAFEAQLPYGATVSYQLPRPLKKVNAWVVRWRRWRAVGTLSDEYEARVWFLVPLLLMHPAAHAVVAWRRRPRAGCCLGCGYDLRGTVSARCPECGTLINDRRRARGRWIAPWFRALALLLAAVTGVAAATGPWSVPLGHGFTWEARDGWLSLVQSWWDPAQPRFQGEYAEDLAVFAAINAPPIVLGERDGWVIRQRHVGRARMLADEYSIRAWFSVLLLLVHPAVHALVAWRRRPHTGCCSGCGYDSRGAVSARCPECGRLISEERRASADARI